MAECLVFGGNGFIGSHLVDALVEDGHEVTIFDRFSDDRNNVTPGAHVRLIRGDFLLRSDIAKAVQGADYVFHFITTTQPITSENNPLVDIDTNVRGSVVLFEECAAAGVKKVVFASTGGSIYGDNSSERMSEDTMPKPVSPYAIGKLAIENYLRYFGRKHGLASVVYRISNPYGERQSLNAQQGVIPIFLQRIARGEPVTVMGDGTMVRDYVHVRDLVRMIARSFMVAEQDIYNVGNGQGSSVNDLVSAMSAVVGHPIEVERREVPPTFVHTAVLDTSRFINEFGAEHTVGLEEGIRRTWDYVQSQMGSARQKKAS